MGPVGGAGGHGGNVEAHAGAHDDPGRNAPKIVASPKCSDTTEKARANVMASPARSARNKLTFSHSVGNAAGHRRLENDP